MKIKSTKRALLVSGLVLLLCVSMLVGSTFAWFSDSVTSKNNIIKSGNLDVVLEYKTADMTDWAVVEDDTALFSEDSLWEPGHTEYVMLRVSNAGTLALKYALKAEVYSEKEGTNVYNQQFLLSDYLKYGIVTEADVDAATTDRETAVAATVTELTSSMDVSGALEDLGLGNGWGQLIGSVSTERALLPAEDNVTALIITMPTTVGNEANYLTGTEAPYIKFGINLYATQQMHEEDSFGDDYDEDAKTEQIEVPIAIVRDNGPVEDLYVESLFGGGLFENEESLRDMDATFTFISPAGVTAYDEWIADYEVSVDADLNDGDAVLAGQYDFIDTDWQAFYTPAVSANQPVRLLGSQNFYMTYADVRDYVGEFNCGVENINVPAGTTMTVALKLYKYAEDDVNHATVLDEITVAYYNYTF
ncbi:MAG: hypothetical protein IJO88_08175 [Oscillospiraceae bacterium]|nr:hypothetical protein [Oscillospiraceae bacterium]